MERDSSVCPSSFTVPEIVETVCICMHTISVTLKDSVGGSIVVKPGMSPEQKFQKVDLLEMSFVRLSLIPSCPHLPVYLVMLNLALFKWTEKH